MQWIRQADLVENFKNGWMHRIAAEVAVEIFVRFQKGDPHPAPR